MLKSLHLLLILLTINSDAFAQFNDEIISPFLGPYKISKTNVGICPNVLMLMAQCTLDQLDLKNTENLDFNFISFKGINSGKMITKINNKIIENNITTFASLQLRSFKESYFSRYKEWFREKNRVRSR